MAACPHGDKGACIAPDRWPLDIDPTSGLQGGRMQNHARLPTPGESAPQLAMDAVGLARSFGGQHALTGLDLAVPEVRRGAHRPQRVREDDDDSHPLDASCSGCWPGDRVRSRCGGGAGGRQGSDRCHRPVLCRGQVPDRQGNFSLMAGLHHLRRAVALERTARDLERFELTGAADRPVLSYSGGMRRRLDLAMTLVGEPRIVFLDEPTAGLDPRGRQVLWRIVRGLVARGDRPADDAVPGRSGSAGRSCGPDRPWCRGSRRHAVRAEDAGTGRTHPAPFRRG